MEESLPPAPRSVGRYVIIEALGAGGMGAVYRALDPILNRHVALKLLRPNPDQDETTRAEWAARMLREAQAAASFVHPHVVAVYDVGVEEGAPFIAMELVAGRPLRDYVGDPAVSLSTRVRWLCDVARALGAAHRAGIVHRDVKPENVVVADDGVVKILDFGIARRTSQHMPAAAIGTLTSDGMIVGTPQYMAPEQIRNEAMDGRVDQFAWGAVAFELLTGRPLWATSAEPLRAIASILTSVAPPPHAVAADVPVAVSDVVERALAKNAADRFVDMDAAADALEAAASAEPGEAPASVLAGRRPVPTALSSGSRAGGQVRRGGAVVWVAAIALVCGVAGGAAVFARQRAAARATATAASDRAQRPIAVLPFDNRTARPEDDWLRIGLADALQTKLATIRGLDVVSLPPGSPPMDAKVAARLGAGVVIAGSFQKIGDRIQVSVRAETLGDAPRTLATAEKRGGVSDVFELQDAIAEALAEKLDGGGHPAFAPAAAGGTRNLEALEALATGRSLLASGRVAEAMRAFDRAVRADPQYRDARANLNRLRADFHHFVVKDDGTVVETISEAVHGDPTAPWQITTDTGSLTRAWDFDGNPLRVERISATGNQATFQVTGRGAEGGGTHGIAGIVYELESASKDKSSGGLDVLFHAVAKNTSGETTFVVQLPRGARALAVLPTPAETHDDDAGPVLVLREARSAFVPYAWSVVHATDPGVIARFRAERPPERAQWIVAADPRMARHGWASDLARVADVAEVCRSARAGALDAAKAALARIGGDEADYGAFFLARGKFCIASAELDDRAAAADLETALSADERPAQLVAETYDDAIDWCLERKRVDDMARLVRLERRAAPWWNDGAFTSRGAHVDDEAQLRAILAREPNNVAARYDLALDLYRAKRFEDAAKALEGADEFLGGIYVTDLRARIAVARGQPADAAAELRKVVMYYPMNWAWIAHAVLLASAGRADEAFAFVVAQAPHSEYQPPLFWALRYVVGMLPHASAHVEAIVDIVNQAKETQYGQPYRLERMIDVVEVASLSLDPDAPNLTRVLLDRFKRMLRDTSPEVCNEACLRSLGVHLCRVRGLGPADIAWVGQMSGAVCQ